MRLSLAFSGALTILLATLAAAAPAPRSGVPSTAKKLVPRLHTDRDAALQFTVPFRHGRILRGARLAEVLAHTPAAPHLAGSAHYTSAVIAAGGMPMVLVWVMPEAAGISRAYVDRLTSEGGKSMLTGFKPSTSLTLENFRFHPEVLRGEADLRSVTGTKTKLLLQLNKDQSSYVAYVYRSPSELADFDTVRHSLTVATNAQLNYRSLANTPAPGAWWATVRAGLLWLAGLGAVAGGAILVYRKMTGDIEVRDAALVTAAHTTHEPKVTVTSL